MVGKMTNIYPCTKGRDKQCDVLFSQCLPTVLNRRCYMKWGSINGLNKRIQSSVKNEQPARDDKSPGPQIAT